MKSFGAYKIRWSVLLLTLLILATPLMGLVTFTPKVSADTTAYVYTDDAGSSIYGPDPEHSGSNIWYYKNDGSHDVDGIKKGGGTYVTNDAYDGNDTCHNKVITLASGKYDNSAEATIENFACDSDEKSWGVQIQPHPDDKKGTWIDHSHINVAGVGVFVDGKIDDTVTFKISPSAATNSCESKSNLNYFYSGNGGNGKDYGNANRTVNLTMYKLSGDAGNNSCIKTDHKLKLSDPGHNYNRWFTWQDAGTISTSDGTTMVFQQKQGSTGGDYFGPGTTCQSYIKADASNPGTGTLVIQSTGGNPFHEGFPDGKNGDTSNQHVGDAKFSKHGDCNVSDPIRISIANPVDASSGQAASSLEAGSADVGSDTDDDSSGSPSLSCHIGVGIQDLNPLNWLLCGVIKGMVSIINVLDNAITSQLSVGTDGNSDDPSQIFCNQGVCSDYHAAWASFRDIALGLMVLAGIIVLISQSLGWELLDAYMIRKTLPRLLIAAVGISLSWQLMEFFVTLTNALGFGVRHLIEAPFHGLGNSVIDLSSPGANGVSIITGLGAVAFGGFGILTFAGTGALALLIAFFVMVLRQIAIIMLLILAPIAIVSYILPNTQKIYRFWWDAFSKALLMFPLIAGFIAAGHVFSLIASQNPSVLNQIVAFAAYFAPYFLIPLTFKFAGGFVRQLGGFVNDRGKGGFDMMRNKRRENTSRRVQRARAGKLWREDWGNFGTDRNGRQRSVSRYANRLATWGLDGDEMIPHLIGSRGGAVGRALFGTYAQKAENTIDNETMDHVGKAAQLLQAQGPLHHKAERALTGLYDGYSAETMNRLHDAGFVDGQGHSVGAPTGVAQINQLADILAQSDDDNELAASGDLRQVAGTLGTINSNPEMYRASANVGAVGAMMLANSGRLDTEGQAQVLNWTAANPRQGRGLAERLEKQTSAVGSRQRPELRHGHGVRQERDADGNLQWHSAFEDPTSARAIDNVTSMKSHELQAAKAETIDEIAPTWAYIMGNGPSGGTDAQGNPIWSNEQELVRQQVFQAASQYSQTDIGAKTKMLEFMDGMSTGGWDMRGEFNQRESRQFDPNQQNNNPNNQGGGGGGGGQGGGGGGQGGGGGGGGQPSDRRLKRHIKHIDTIDNSIKLYSFQYLWSDQVYVGVMAQDLVDSHPEALSKDANGFYRVDYSRLGLRMVTIEQWDEQQASIRLN
jgi:hypothetical protein